MDKDASNKPQSSWFTTVSHVFILLLQMFSWLWRHSIGETKWTAPPWALWLGKQIKPFFKLIQQHPFAWSVALLLPVFFYLGYSNFSYLHSLLPEKNTGFVLTEHSIETQKVSYELITPTFSSHSNNSNLYLRFHKQVTPLVGADAGEEILHGIQLDPSIKGNWFWVTDREVKFVPSQNWIPGEKYQVTLSEKNFLHPAVELINPVRHFTVPAFQLSNIASEFYQDPIDPNIKKVIVNYTFNYPVDPVLLERGIEIKREAGLEFSNKVANDYQITYSKDGKQAYLHTNLISIPKIDRSLHINLNKNISSKYGGNAIGKVRGTTQVVPGRGKLKVTSAEILVVDEGDLPEQILSIRTNFPVSETEFTNKAKLWLLPNNVSLSSITEQVLLHSKPLKVAYLPGEFESSQVHNLKIDIKKGQRVYLQVDEGLTAIGGFEMIDTHSQTVYFHGYNKRLKFMSQGSILPLSGDGKLAILSRGIDEVDINISQVLPNQVHHFIRLNNSLDKNNLYQYGDSFNSLVSKFSGKLEITEPDDKNNSVTAYDFAEELRKRNIKSGVFIVRLHQSGISTQRLVNVTDIGIIVKQNLAATMDLYAASVTTGEPLNNAKVDLIGLNGLPISSAITDSNGHVTMAVSSYGDERKMLMYRVTKDNDVAFIPYSDSSRAVNLSRFDIGGVQHMDDTELSAYVFSDRRLYRPGETAQIMFIVGTGDPKISRESLPVQLDIFDPRGKVVFSQRLSLHKSGFNSFSHDLAETAITGEYLARISRVATRHGYKHLTALGSHNFNVREFEPERLKVTASLSDQNLKGWLKPKDIQAKINVQHLFGTPADGSRVEAELSIAPTRLHFKPWQGYIFSSQYIKNKAGQPITEALASQTTDALGNAYFNLDLTRFNNATYILSILSQAFEKGSGRGVNAGTEVLVSDSDFMLGYKADGPLGIKHNSRRQVHLLVIDPTLTPIAHKEIYVEVSEIRFVSSLSRQNNGTYKYISRQREFKLTNTSIEIPVEGYELNLDSSQPGSYIVRISSVDGKTLASFNYQVSGTANLTRSLERNAELDIKLDATEYTPGEEIAINIIAPYVGSGLITIERDRVYASKWFKTDTTSSVQTITLPPDLEGNAYINVQFFRANSSEDIYMSPLSYAVAPFSIDRQARVIQADLIIPSKVQPGNNIAATLNTNEPSRIALVAVDEGILQVAKFNKPDPLNHFLKKARLQVRTLQTLDMILPNFSQVLAAAAGGDEFEATSDTHASLLAQNLNPFKKKRNAPMVWWSGIKDIEKGQHTFNIPVPDYFNGDVRVYAVLATQEKLQVLEQHSKVQADIILSPNVPPAVAPRDEVDLTLGVYNNIKGSGSLPFLVELDLPKGAQILNDAKQVVSLAEGKEASVNFRVRFNGDLGAQRIIFKAQSGGYNAKYAESISLRPATPYRTSLNAGMVRAKNKVTLDNIRSMHSEYADTDLSISASPLIWAKGLTEYLNNYAHICTEQLTSKAIPTIILAQHKQLKSENSLSFESIISTLRSRQNSKGGFGLWQASNDANRYATLYAAQFLIEAKALNYAVPEDLLNSTLSYVKAITNLNYNNISDLRQKAWAIYLLTREGKIMSRELTSLRADLDKYAPDTWKKSLTGAYIAATLALQQQSDLALEIMSQVSWTPDPTIRLGYQDDLTEQSIHLQLLARHFPSLIKNVPESVLLVMSQTISQQRYHSHSAAWLILALESYHLRLTQEGVQFSLNLQTTDDQPHDIQLEQNNGQHSAAIPQNTQAITIENTGMFPLFFSTHQSGFDKAIAPAKQNGIEIYRDFVSLEKKPLDRLVVGDEFLVRIRLKALKSQHSELAIVDLLPGGIEPVPVIKEEGTRATYQTSLLNSIVGPWNLSFDNQRDDRMLIYGWLNGNDYVEFTYRVRAVNAGTYTVPPAFVNAMYDPSYHAITAPSQLVIHAAK